MNLPKELEFLLFGFFKSREKEFFKHSHPDILLEIKGKFKAFGQKAVFEDLKGLLGKTINSDDEVEVKFTSKTYKEVIFNSKEHSYTSMQMEVKNSRYSYLNLEKKDTI